jgi:hypothetical protein
VLRWVGVSAVAIPALVASVLTLGSGSTAPKSHERQASGSGGASGAERITSLAPRREHLLARSRRPVTGGIPSAGGQSILPRARSWDELRSRWVHEKPDPDWTANVSSYATSLLDSVDASTNLLVQVDCRETACRALWRANGGLALFRASQLAGPEGFQFSYTTEHDGGTSQVVAFIAREGAEPLETVAPSATPTSGPSAAREPAP